jgi:hypothetical protein
MIHNMDISKWPDSTFAKWLALVNKIPALEWNHKVIDPAMVSASASTAKAKP